VELVPEGEIRIATAALGHHTLDPILSDPLTIPYMRLMYDPIIGADPATGMLSENFGVTEKWDLTSNLLTLHIREGIKFQNGDNLTAEDVKFTLERAISPESTTGYGTQINALVTEISVTDPSTVVITTVPGGAPLLTYLLSPVVSTDGYVVPKDYIEAKGVDYFREHPIGSGPYQLKTYTYGHEMVLEAVNLHWRIGVPKYKDVRFMVIPEEATMNALLERGETDIAIVSIEQAPALVDKGFNLITKKDAVVFYLNVAGEHCPGTPFNDIRVREALEIAIDRQTISDALYSGLLTPAKDDLAVTCNDCGWDLSNWSYPYDPDKAKDLLQQYGKPVSFTFYTLDASGVDAQVMDEAIAGFWSAVGFDVSIVPMDKAAYSGFLSDLWAQDECTTNAILGPGVPATRPFVSWATLISKVLASNNNDRGLHGGDRPLDHPGEHRFTPLVDQMMAYISAGEIEKAKATAFEIVTLFRPEYTSIPLFTGSYPVITQPELNSWNLGILQQDFNFEDLLKR
jgi:peptide/nickel transport system substrate-binding protein